MKSSRLSAVFAAVTLAIAVLAGCAAGDLGPQGHQQAESDAGADAANNPDDVSSGEDVSVRDTGFDASDASGADDTNVPDVADDANVPDATEDTSSADAGQDTTPPGPCASVRCGAGTVCDPASGDCVECLADSDCGAGRTCDTTTSTCVGCLSDADCAAGAHCHDTAQICVPACCDNTVQQEAFSSTAYNHNRFDIDVTDAGEPAIAFIDGDDDTVKFAQQLNSQWLSQDVETLTNSSSADVRMALGPGGEPHIIVTRYEFLRHYWRDSAGWHSEDLLASPPSVGYCDIAVDDQGGAHMVALLEYGDRVLYSYKPAAGTLNNQDLSLPSANPPVWTNLALTSDGRPVASFQIGLDKTVYIAEMNASGTWQYEQAGQDVAQVHGLGVGPNDEPVIAYRRDSANDGLRLLRRQGQSWTDELVVADPDHGYSPDVAVDSLGDPHVVYMAQGAAQYDNPLYYARWNGVQWEHYEMTGVDRAFYPRVAVDANRIAHAVVYDPSRDTISYLKIQ